MTCCPLETSRQLQSVAFVSPSINAAFLLGRLFYLYIFLAFVCFLFLIKAVLNRRDPEGKSPLLPLPCLINSLFSEKRKKRRELKSKGEKERYSHLNAEFQRTARRDKKAFLSDQCKEIEDNNRMGKTRDLFKKIGDTKGTFHAKMGSIKDRNGRT